MESFVDTPGFLLWSLVRLYACCLKQRKKCVFVDSMSSRKKLRTRAIACAALYILFNKEEKKTKRKTWVKKWRLDRDRYGHTPLLRELRDNDPEDYKNYLRMDNTFEYLLNLVSPRIPLIFL
jgi:hypothetical protein